jgi:hypothetical protein
MEIHHKTQRDRCQDTGLAPRKEVVVSRKSGTKPERKPRKEELVLNSMIALCGCELVPVDNQIQVSFSSIDLHSTT